MKEITKIVVACTTSRRNPIAAQLHQAQYRKQIVKTPKLYTRKGRKSMGSHHD